MYFLKHFFSIWLYLLTLRDAFMNGYSTIETWLRSSWKTPVVLWSHLYQCPQGLSLSCTSHPVQLAKMHQSITRSFATEHFLIVHTENWWKRGALSEKIALKDGHPVCSKHKYIWGIYFLPTLLACFQSTKWIVWLLRRQMLSLAVGSPTGSTEGWAEPGADNRVIESPMQN